MAIYWILVALVFLVSVPIQRHPSKSSARVYLLIVFLMLWIVSGFRAFSVGIDTKEYVGIFNNIGDLALLKDRFEIGFLRYTEILHGISANAGILLMVSSAICIGIACLFTEEFSKNPVLSMLLYILLGDYFSQMNAMRQAIAVSLMMISFMVLLKTDGGRQRFISALLILLAAAFHTIAIVGVIPWILVVLSNSDKKAFHSFTASKMLKITLLISGIAFVVFPIIMVVAAKLLPPYYAAYLEGEWSDSNYNASLFNTLIQLAFAIVGVIVFKNKELNKEQRFAAIMLSLTIFFEVLSMRMEIWGRIAGFFSIYTDLLWASEVTAEIQSTKIRRILNTTIVLCSAAYMLIVLTFRPEWTLVIPYRFGW